MVESISIVGNVHDTPRTLHVSKPSWLIAPMYMINIPDELNSIHPCNHAIISAHARAYPPYACVPMPMLISPLWPAPCPMECFKEEEENWNSFSFELKCPTLSYGPCHVVTLALCSSPLPISPTMSTFCACSPPPPNLSKYVSSSSFHMFVLGNIFWHVAFSLWIVSWF